MRVRACMIIGAMIFAMSFAVCGPNAAQAQVNCSGVAAWSANSVSYAVGALVTYNGSEYKCIQAHTSQAAWNPVSAQSLWSLVGACSSSTGSTTGGSCSASPSAPTGLTASGTTSSGTNLSWTAVSPPANCTISSYTIFKGGSSIGTSTSTSFSVTGLSASTTYSFTVAATDSIGTSAQSSSVSVTTSSGGGTTGGGTTGGGGGIQIACGNTAQGSFVADTDFSGGANSGGTTSSINTSKVTNPAPTAVYQHGRKGTCTYTIPGLTSGSTYNVRLDFCEYAATASGARTFNVSINGAQVLTNYDIFANAGGEFIANAQSFTATANASGQIVIAFTTVVNNVLVAGIEVSAGGSSGCTANPGAPTGLAASGTTSSGTTLSWSAVSAPSGCSITSYTVYKGGTSIAAVGGTSYTVTGLSASTTYSFTVAASDSHGTGSQSSALSVTTSAGSSGGGTTTGSVKFHVTLGGNMGNESITLDGGNFNDLIMSNVISGVMLGHMIDEGFPGMPFNKDYLYGSDMGQLLQENLETNVYVDTSNLIDPSPDQAGLFGVGQGGPYQINNYAVDMVGGTTAPVGHSLINYIAVQKNIGYTMANASSQSTKVTPPSFNDKYYGPMLPAFFHYNDMVALNVIGKGPNGYVTPWEPAYDNMLAHFLTLPNNFLDMILNVAYNQGYYGGLVNTYSVKGETATASTIATINAYTSVWGDTITYDQYPYQVHYYLDQMYDNPIPTTSATTLVTPTNHIAFPISTLESVFSNVFQKLDYSNGTAAAQFFTASQATTAFNSALSSNGVPGSATLDLSTASDRAKIWAVLDSAIGNLENAVGMKFNATTLNQL